jgi:hypothetical protein
MYKPIFNNKIIYKKIFQFTTKLKIYKISSLLASIYILYLIVYKCKKTIK